MRNRYVSQVLLATLGFGLLLGVIAVLQTPADLSLRGTGAPQKQAESPQCHAHEPAALTQKATPTTNDRQDDCQFPIEPCND